MKPRANMSNESGYLIGKIVIGYVRKCDMKIEQASVFIYFFGDKLSGKKFGYTLVL